jgi:hypothetical protein
MSNAQVGNVYSQIIGDVIESSRVDFEEGGVDEAVLEELKTVCRESILSQIVTTQRSYRKHRKEHILPRYIIALWRYCKVQISRRCRGPGGSFVCGCSPRLLLPVRASQL